MHSQHDWAELANMVFKTLTVWSVLLTVLHKTKRAYFGIQKHIGVGQLVQPTGCIHSNILENSRNSGSREAMPSGKTASDGCCFERIIQHATRRCTINATPDRRSWNFYSQLKCVEDVLEVSCIPFSNHRILLLIVRLVKNPFCRYKVKKLYKPHKIAKNSLLKNLK